MNTLPNELLLMIYNFIPGELNRIILSLTSKRFYNLLKKYKTNIKYVKFYNRITRKEDVKIYNRITREEIVILKKDLPLIYSLVRNRIVDKSILDYENPYYLIALFHEKEKISNVYKKLNDLRIKCGITRVPFYDEYFIKVFISDLKLVKIILDKDFRYVLPKRSTILRNIIRYANVDAFKWFCKEYKGITKCKDIAYFGLNGKNNDIRNMLNLILMNEYKCRDDYKSFEYCDCVSNVDTNHLTRYHLTRYHTLITVCTNRVIRDNIQMFKYCPKLFDCKEHHLTRCHILITVCTNSVIRDNIQMFKYCLKLFDGEEHISPTCCVYSFSKCGCELSPDLTRKRLFDRMVDDCLFFELIVRNNSLQILKYCLENNFFREINLKNKAETYFYSSNYGRFFKE